MAADSSNSVHRRRVSKPLIEKRRRARINSCLAQLKDMIAKQKSTVHESRASRLEKADILEMTVEYVRKIHAEKHIGTKQIDLPHQFDLENSFEEGYKLCMAEVHKFFTNNIRKKASKENLNNSLQKYLRDRCDIISLDKKNTSKPSLSSPRSETLSSNSSDEYSNEMICEEGKFQRDTLENTETCLSSYSFKSKSFVTNGNSTEADKIHIQSSSEIMWRPW